MKDPLVFYKNFKGFYIQFQNFNRTRRINQWSFALGGCQEPVYVYGDDYNSPMTEKGRDIYFFATFFNYQISFGHRKTVAV